jgi:hypothetical protein
MLTVPLVVHDIAPKLQYFAVDGCGNPLVSFLPLYALGDPMMLESILFHAAVHEDARNGRPWTASTWYHRGRSIELVNQRLALPGNESTSDLVIGSVSFIGTVGVSTPCSLATSFCSDQPEYYWRCRRCQTGPGP